MIYSIDCINYRKFRTFGSECHLLRNFECKVHGRSSPAPVKEVVCVVLHEGRLQADAAATQDETGYSAELFGRFFDALKLFGLVNSEH